MRSLILARSPRRGRLAQQPDPYYPTPRFAPATAPGTASQYPNQAVSFTEPSADNRAGSAPAAQLSIREQGPNDFQTEIVRPIPVTAGDSNSLLPGQPAVDGRPRGTPGAEPRRPGDHSAGHSGDSGAAAIRRRAGGPAPAGVQPPSEAARPTQALASPFDPSQFRLPTLGLPPGLGTPEPTPEIKREYGQFVEREIVPENTIQVVVGRAKVIVLREKPRRIYVPDENVAGFQIVTDEEFAVVGKKAGRTVLNLWFPDPRNPNNPQKDRTLSYLVVVLPDPERAALDVLEERKRLEAQVKAFEQALKVLEREIKEAFPDSAVQLSLVGEQVVVRGESKDVVEAAQILRIVAEHSPTARRTQGRSPKNVNVTFIPGLGDEQAAVDAIRQILQGNPNLVNLLRVPGEQQVMLMVTVAEVNRTAARTIGMDFSIAKGPFAFAQITGGTHLGRAATAAATGASAAAQACARRRQPAHGHRQRQRAHGDPGPADLELRAEPGGTQPDHAQRQAGELSGRRVLSDSQQRHPPRRRRAERDLPELRRLAAIRPLYHRPQSHPPAIECQRIDPQHGDHRRSAGPTCRARLPNASSTPPSNSAKARRSPSPA